MIEVFFNFQRMPFAKEIKPADLFETTPRTELTARLEYMRKNHGIFLLTGNPGTGKTTALRGWVDSLSETSHKIVYIPQTTMSAYDLFCCLNEEFAGQPSNRKSRLFASVQAAILDLVSLHRKLPVIIFDDAHYLPLKTLLELPLILNFRMDSIDPVLVILSGHESIAARLRNPNLRHLDQRITLRHKMPELNEESTNAYINHRMRLAGGDPDIFQPAALAAIHKVSRGTHRLINRLCTDALTLAALDQRHLITEEDVFNASKSF